MEAKDNKTKVIHQSYTIQFNDKAIEGLKYNKKLEKRQRIRVHLKNGPGGVTLRWTPKTNKKIFQLEYKFRSKSYVLDCGQFQPGSFTCNSLNKYLIRINDKHRNDDGTFKTNPKVEIITKDQLKQSQLKTVRECIELICEENFPRKNIKGKLSALSQKDHTRFLIGYNKRRDHITFIDDDKGWGKIIFKEQSTIKDWKTLFKTYPKGTGVAPGGETSVYDSYLGDVIVDDLIPGNIEIYLNERTRSYGQKENIRKSLACLWSFARKRNFMGPNPPLNPTRLEDGGITIEKEEESQWLGSKYNEMTFDLAQLEEIDNALISLKDKFPFQSECLRLMLHTGMRGEECKKITRSMITTDKLGNPVIELKRYIAKGRTHQQQKDIIYDITPQIRAILDSLKTQLDKPEFKPYQFVPWLFPTTRISLEKLSNPDKYPNYAKSHNCRTKTLDDTWNAVRKITHFEGSIKTLRKAFVGIANDTLGGAHKGKKISKHKTEQINSGVYDKASRTDTKNMANKVGEVLSFKKG